MRFHKNALFAISEEHLNFAIRLCEFYRNHDTCVLLSRCISHFDINQGALATLKVIMRFHYNALFAISEAHRNFAIRLCEFYETMIIREIA